MMQVRLLRKQDKKASVNKLILTDQYLLGLRTLIRPIGCYGTPPFPQLV
jgi:hypothetical protein